MAKPPKRRPSKKPKRSPRGKPSKEALTFHCTGCGEEHDLADLSLYADAPAQWRALSGAERADSVLGDETCLIRTKEEGISHFMRAVLEVPIAGKEATFSWGVWVSLSEKSFKEVMAHWEDPARADLGPYFGWLCTEVPGYPKTMFLKTSVRQREVGVRPLVILEPTEHPLAVHQRQGIPQEELQRIVTEELHGD